MATQTYEQLIAGANKIKENELPESNTHDIVGVQLLQMTNKMHEESSNTTKAFTDLETDRVRKTTELNISNLYPIQGIGGTNKYDLATAIAQVPEQYRMIAGLKITFIDNATNKTETWKYDGGTFTDTGSWTQISGGGNKILKWNTDVATTRKSLAYGERKSGIKVSYKPDDSDWINEQYIGNDFTDTEWVKDSNWVKTYSYNMSLIDVADYIFILTDNDNKIIAGVSSDGKFIFFTDVVYNYIKTKNLEAENLLANFIKLPNDGASQLKDTLSLVRLPKQNDLQSKYIDYIKEKDLIKNSLIYSPTYVSNYCIINVNQQSDFDNIQTTINQKIDEGFKTIIVLFADGIFYYSEQHINLQVSYYPNLADVSLIFTSNGNTKLLPKGEWLSIEDASEFDNTYYVLPFEETFDYNDMFLDENFNELSLWQRDISYVYDTEKISEGHYKCRIDGYENMTPSDAYICFPTGYSNAFGKIEKIEDGYLYYAGNKPAAGRVVIININSESGLKIANNKIYIPLSISKVFRCKDYGFLYSVNVRCKNIEVSNLTFIGSKYNYDKSLLFININTTVDTINISHNKFINHKGSLFRCSSQVEGVKLFMSDNEVENVYHYAFNSAAPSCIRYNKFKKVGLTFGSFLGTPTVVRCSGKNSYVADNYFIDFGGVAIALTPAEQDGFLIAERNIAVYSDEFLQNPLKYLGSDFGVIYCAGFKTIVRDNIISCPPKRNDLTYNNYGIFGDNSPYSMIVYRNLILNHSKSDFDIHIRNASSLNPSELGSTANFIGFNIVSYKYLLQGRQVENNGCIKATNIRLFLKDENTVSFCDTEDDYLIGDAIINKDLIIISSEFKKIIDSTDINFSDFVKSYIVYK